MAREIECEVLQILDRLVFDFIYNIKKTLNRSRSRTLCGMGGMVLVMTGMSCVRNSMPRMLDRQDFGGNRECLAARSRAI